jgi:hypothetical protein
MPKDDDSARRELRELLTTLRDGLDQPPLSVRFRLTMEAVLDLLGEQDLGKRLAAREHIGPSPGRWTPGLCGRG